MATPDWCAGNAKSGWLSFPDVRLPQIKQVVNGYERATSTMKPGAGGRVCRQGRAGNSRNDSAASVTWTRALLLPARIGEQNTELEYHAKTSFKAAFYYSPAGSAWTVPLPRPSLLELRRTDGRLSDCFTLLILAAVTRFLRSLSIR